MVLMPTTQIQTDNPYPTSYYSGRADGTAAGFFTDHTRELVQAAAYDLRVDGVTFPQITEQLGLQHWDHAQAAVRSHARRMGVEVPVSHRRPTPRRIGGAGYLLNRRFGIEIECSRGTMVVSSNDRTMANGFPVGTAAEHMRQQGLDAQADAYNHVTASRWKVIYDYTVTGVEAVSPILRGDAGYEEVRAACRGLKAAGATPGGGVHVHHDINDFDTVALARLLTVLRHTQHALGRFHTARRRRTSWCAPVSSYEWDAADAAVTRGTCYVNNSGRRAWPAGWNCGVGRYHAFNLEAIGCYGTVEFRGHGASLNPAKLRPWIAMGQAVIEFARLGGTFDTAQSVNSMIEALTAAGVLTARAAADFKARVRELGGEHALEVS